MKCEKCGQEIPEKKVIKIISRDGNVLFQSSRETIKEAVEEAVREGANLEGVSTEGCTLNFVSSEYAQAKQFIEGLKR